MAAIEGCMGTAREWASQLGKAPAADEEEGFEAPPCKRREA